MVEKLNSLDYVFIAVLALFMIRGFWKGGIVLIFNVIGFFAGFIASMNFYKDVEALIRHLAPSIQKADIIAFVLLFVMAWFLVGALGHWLSNILVKVKLKIIDRLLGAFIGFILAIIVQSIIFSTLTLFLPPSHPVIKNSQLAPYVSKSSSVLAGAVSKHVGKELENKKKELQKYWQQRTSGNGHSYKLSIARSDSDEATP